MVKKILSSVLTASLVCASAAPVYSASDISVGIVFDAASGVAHLSGQASGAVSITVVPVDVTFSDYSTELERCIYFGFAAAKDGRFTHSFNIPSGSEAGKYIVYITSKDGAASCSFNNISALDEAELLSINSAGSASELKVAAEALSTKLGIDMTSPDYEQCSSDAYKIVYAMGKKYDSSAEFYADYNGAYAISAIVNNEDTEAALKKNASLLGIDYSNDFAEDSRLDASAKQTLLSSLAKNDWTKSADKYDAPAELFAESYSVLRAVAAVQSAETRVQLQKAMCEDFADEFDFVEDNTKYKKLKNPDKTFSLMLNDNLSSFESIKNSFEDAVNKRYKEENETKSTGGGGGGGSVGISSSVAPPITPAVPLPDETKEEDKTDSIPKFADVLPDFWGYTAVTVLASKGMINGYEDSTFKPNKNITRAEFAKLILSAYEAAGGKLAGGGSAFVDVTKSDWYYDVADKTSALGIILGSDGSFRPNEDIKREDAAAIIYRALNCLGMNYYEEKSFADDSLVSDYAKKAVSYLAGAGIINGFEDLTFRPADTLTRAQAAQMLFNITNK